MFMNSETFINIYQIVLTLEPSKIVNYVELPLGTIKTHSEIFRDLTVLRAIHTI